MTQKWRTGLAIKVLVPVVWMAAEEYSSGLARAAVYESGGSETRCVMRRDEARSGRFRVFSNGFESSDGEGRRGGGGCSGCGGEVTGGGAPVP